MNRQKMLSVLLLAGFGLFLIATDPWVNFVDDENAIIYVAGQPLGDALQRFAGGQGQHEHPPLYDLLLHAWLRMGGGEMRLVRLPSIIFFLAGLAILAGCAERLGGQTAFWAVLWIGFLWPFGFHFGRLAGWYSFSFLLVSALTALYFKFLDQPSAGSWAAVVLLGIALVYTNYFGWALLGLLGLDYLLRRRNTVPHWWKAGVLTAMLLVAAYLPIWQSLFTRLGQGVGPKHSATGSAMLGAFHLYALFVSESVAPWYWMWSLPVSLCIAIALLIVALRAPRDARLFLAYFLLLFASMTVLGLLTTKRLLLVAAWLLLPLAVALAQVSFRTRRWLSASLAIIAAIGWMGILSKRFYAAPRFVEPWREVSDQIAQRVRAGDVVIGNNPTFFVYLTYSLNQPDSAAQQARTPFSGLLPYGVRHPLVYDPQQWLEGMPVHSGTLLVKGAADPGLYEPTQAVERELDSRCTLQAASRMAPDEGFALKQRYFPGSSQLPWRIEIRDYRCNGGQSALNSKPQPETVR